MSKKRRKLLFWLAFVAFAVIAPLIVGYARGYRVDLRRGGVTQVGAIFLESKPKGAIVLLDNKDVSKKTPALLANLFPFETYLIGIEKKGFKTWHKKLLVEPSKINRVEQIILPPEEFLREEVIATTTPLNEFSLGPDGRLGLGLREEQKGVFGLYFLDLSSKTLVPIVFPDRLSTRGVEKLVWKNDSSQAVFLRLTRSGKSWYLLNVSNRTATNINLALPSSFKPSVINFLPTGELLALNGENLVLINSSLEFQDDWELAGIEMFEVGDNRIFALTDSQTMAEFDLRGDPIRDYGRLEFKPAAFHLSPDNKKVVYQDENKIGILWISDAERAPFYKRGDQEVVFKTTERIESFWWHAGSEGFLVFLENKELVFGELDGRGGRNVWRWSMDGQKSIAYSAKEKSLWFLTDQGALTRYPDDF